MKFIQDIVLLDFKNVKIVTTDHTFDVAALPPGLTIERKKSTGEQRQSSLNLVDKVEITKIPGTVGGATRQTNVADFLPYSASATKAAGNSSALDLSSTGSALNLSTKSATAGGDSSESAQAAAAMAAAYGSLYSAAAATATTNASHKSGTSDKSLPSDYYACKQKHPQSNRKPKIFNTKCVFTFSPSFSSMFYSFCSSSSFRSVLGRADPAATTDGSFGEPPQSQQLQCYTNSSTHEQAKGRCRGCSDVSFHHFGCNCGENQGSRRKG